LGEPAGFVLGLRENLVEVLAAWPLPLRPHRAGFTRQGIVATTAGYFTFQRAESSIQGATGMAGNRHT